MRTFFTKTIVILACIIFSMPAAVKAAGDLSVDLESTPLFAGAVFAPEQTISRFIKVVNNSPTSQTIAIEAINHVDSGNLAGQFFLKIYKAGTPVYFGTLADFFAPGEKDLSNLAGNGDEAQYDVSLTLDKNAGNALQNQSLSFDLLVGFKGSIPDDNQDVIPGGGSSGGSSSSGGGGGASGGSLPAGLTIYEDQVTVSNITTTSATINWLTSYGSTSQVVYVGTGEPYSFVVDPSLQYGYPHASPEDSTKVTEHHVTVTGLSAALTYHFRVISHASPPTVSYEHAFTTLALGQVAGAEVTGIPNPKVLGSSTVKPRQEKFEEDIITENGIVLGESTTTPVALGVAPKPFSENSFVCQAQVSKKILYLVYGVLLLVFLFLFRKVRRTMRYLAYVVIFSLTIAAWFYNSCLVWQWGTPLILAVVLALVLVVDHGTNAFRKPVNQ
jgi:hypothetical protein